MGVVDCAEGGNVGRPKGTNMTNYQRGGERRQVFQLVALAARDSEAGRKPEKGRRISYFYFRRETQSKWS